MPTPFPPRQAAPTSWSGAAKTKPTTSELGMALHAL